MGAPLNWFVSQDCGADAWDMVISGSACVPVRAIKGKRLELSTLKIVHKTLMIDLVTYVQNILQPSFVGFLDFLGSRHLPTLPKP